MDLRIVRIRQLLYILAPVGLKFCNMMLETHYNPAVGDAQLSSG